MVQRLKSNVPTGITAYRDPETGEIAGSYQPNKVMAQLTAEGVNRIGDTIAELPLLDAIEELSRLCALFGFGEQAAQRVAEARERVDAWRTARTKTPNDRVEPRRED